MKLVKGSYDAADSVFRLIIERNREKPKPGSAVVLTFLEGVFPIIEVNELPDGKRYEIIAANEDQVTGNLDQLIKRCVGKEIICGLKIPDYKRLQSGEKLAYFKELADLIPAKHVSAFIKEHIQLCVALFPFQKPQKDAPSKLGGRPYAPKDFVFPKDKQGKSALFIGQIHIGEFNRYFETTKQLKGTGILYFFGTIVITQGTYHHFEEILVRYTDQIRDLEEIPLPSDIKEYGVFEEKDLIVSEEVSLPQDESILADKLDFPLADRCIYWDFGKVVMSYDYFDPPEGPYFDSIKLMGHPQQLQHCVLLETVFKHSEQGWYNPDESLRETPEITEEAKQAALRWRHLFSFDSYQFRKMSNFEGEFNYFMARTFYVMIEQDDLDRMNFDHIESVYQFT